MKKLFSRRPTPGMAVAIVAMIVAISGVAVAAIPDGGGVIHACYNTNNGRVRLTDTDTNKPKPCSNRETSVTWNQTGPQYAGPHWGIITRNSIGSPVADLRSGPFGSFGVTGPSASPPFGDGSLGIEVNDVSGKVEKVAFGNEVDFLGDPVLDIDNVGFQVFQTGENAAISAGNMPNITFEIDPNLASSPSGYSSMVFAPGAAPVTNEWSGYIDATSSGDWYLTGAAGTASGCNQTTVCSFTGLKTALADGGDDPIVYTAAVAKGRDNQWVGAVDGLRINSTIYDFEPFGVNEIAAP